MEALAIVSKGTEEIAADEIKELINAETELKEGCVIFRTEEILDICKICYCSQSVERVLLLFGFFNFKECPLESIKDLIDNVDYKNWIGKKQTFRVNSERVGDHKFSSQDVEQKIGEMIIDTIRQKLKYSQKVSLKEPDVRFFIYIFGNAAYFGIDFSGFEMHKRDYNVFVNPRALRSTIAYCLIRLAEYDGKETLLDPYAGSGTIPIEAVMFASKISPNFYSKEKFAFLKLSSLKKIEFDVFFERINNLAKSDKLKIYSYDSLMRSLYASKKNAKIAGVDKLISFSRMDAEWIDTKFEKNSVDKIITCLPLTNKINNKEVEKAYNEFFYQAEYILKNDGKIVAASNNQEILNKSALKYSFKISEIKNFWSGKQKLDVFIIIKSKK